MSRAKHRRQICRAAVHNERVRSLAVGRFGVTVVDPGSHGLRAAGRGVRFFAGVGGCGVVAGAADEPVGLHRRGAVCRRAAGASPGTLVLTTAIINLRHVFYGLTLLHVLPASRWARGAGLAADRRNLRRDLHPAAGHAAAPAGADRLAEPWLVGAGHAGRRAAGHALHPGLDRHRLCAGGAVRGAGGRAVARHPAGAALWRGGAGLCAGSWLVPAQALAVAIGVGLAAAVLLPQRAWVDEAA